MTRCPWAIDGGEEVALVADPSVRPRFEVFHNVSLGLTETNFDSADQLVEGQGVEIWQHLKQQMWQERAHLGHKPLTLAEYSRNAAPTPAVGVGELAEGSGVGGVACDGGGTSTSTPVVVTRPQSALAARLRANAAVNDGTATRPATPKVAGRRRRAGDDAQLLSEPKAQRRKNARADSDGTDEKDPMHCQRV